jgi:mycothiol synthase
VLPNKSAWTVRDFRDRYHPERAVLVAELDGEIVGAGLGGRSEAHERAFAAPRVHPAARRRGIGTALLRGLAEHAVERIGVDEIQAFATDPGACAFAEAFGFREIDRHGEQVRRLEHESLFPRLPRGIDVSTSAERPELLEVAYPLVVEGWADMASSPPATLELEDWLHDEATLPGGSFVALASGEIVGFAGLRRHGNAGVAENGLTVVRRDWRRRGLAAALKTRTIDWARANGLREILTWTQRSNEGMRAVNERLGYEYRAVHRLMVAPLPLKGLA